MQAVLDIFLSRGLYFLAIVIRVNCHKEAHSASTAKKETLSLESKLLKKMLGIPGLCRENVEKTKERDPELSLSLTRVDIPSRNFYFIVKPKVREKSREMP